MTNGQSRRTFTPIFDDIQEWADSLPPDARRVDGNSKTTVSARNIAIVFGQIWTFCNSQGYCDKSHNYLSRRHGISRTTVQRAINILVGGGQLLRHRRPVKGKDNETNVYSLPEPMVGATTPPSVAATTQPSVGATTLKDRLKHNAPKGYKKQEQNRLSLFRDVVQELINIDPEPLEGDETTPTY